MERPPISQEREAFISDEECLVAMRGRNFERVQEWYKQQEVIADQNSDQQARLDFQLRYAKIQFDSGLIDEDTGESYAFPTLEALRDAFPASRDEDALRIQAVIDQMRGV